MWLSKSSFRGRWNSDNDVYQFWTTRCFNVPMDRVIFGKVYNDDPSAASSLFITIRLIIISKPSSSQLFDWIKSPLWGGVSVFGHQNKTGLPRWPTSRVNRLSPRHLSLGGAPEQEPEGCTKHWRWKCQTVLAVDGDSPKAASCFNSHCPSPSSSSLCDSIKLI